MSHLALYSVVRSNPPAPPNMAWHSNTPQMRITDFNSETSYLQGLTCNMDVRADIGRSPGRSTPSPGTDI